MDPDEVREELRERYGLAEAEGDASSGRETREPPDATVGVPDQVTGEVEFAHDEPQVEPAEESKGTEDEREEREQLREYLTKEYGELGEESGGPKATDPRESPPAGEQATLQERREQQPESEKFQQEVAQVGEPGRQLSANTELDAREPMERPSEEQRPPAAEQGQNPGQDDSMEEAQHQHDSSLKEEAPSSNLANAYRKDDSPELTERQTWQPGERERIQQESEVRREESRDLNGSRKPADRAGTAEYVSANSGRIQADTNETASQQTNSVGQENATGYPARNVQDCNQYSREPPPESLGQGRNSKRDLANLTLTPHFSRDGSSPFFEVSRFRLQQQSGTRLEEGRLYRITGRVEDTDFETYRVGTRASHFKVFVPGEFQNRFQPGHRYTVVISSVEEKRLSGPLAGAMEDARTRSLRHISKWFDYHKIGGAESQLEKAEERGIISIARKATGRDNLRFNLLNSYVEKISGVTLEEGKKYNIKGRIETIGAFEANHLQRKNIATSIEVPRQFRDNVKDGKAYEITIDSVVEMPRLRTVLGREGVYLRISRATAKEFGLVHGPRREHVGIVTEFKLQNVSKPGEPIRRYFSGHEAKPSYQIRVDKGGARVGDVFRLVEAKENGIEDFIKDFGEHGFPGGRNLGLTLRENRLSLEVDGQTIPFEKWRLSSFGGKVSLMGKLEHVDRELKFSFDGENITGQFGQYSRLGSIKATRYGIEISYFNDTRRELRYRQNLIEFDRGAVIDGVALVSQPEREGEPYTFAVPPSVSEYVQFRLGAIGKYRGYMYEKGRISEELQRHLVVATGQWDEVATHPTRYGPDGLQRYKISKELYYLEYKWVQSKSIEGTRADATAQAIRDLRRRPYHENERVAGAYIGLLYWDGGPTGKFYLEKVWPQT